MSGLLPSIFLLGTLAVVSVLLANTRRSSEKSSAERQLAARVLALAVSIQALHFAEEAVTGFHERFPALFRLPEIPLSIFLGFNLLWIAIWVASVGGIRAGRPSAFFAAWFLALAGILNGIGHPLMALSVGGYFPGLVSSPIIGLASAWLWRCLRRATDNQ